MERTRTIALAAALQLALVAACAGRAYAHDPGLSSSSLQRSSSELRFSVLVHNADLRPDRRATAASCNVQGVWDIRLDGQPLTVVGECRLHDPQHTAFDGHVELAHSGTLSLRLALLAELPRGHRNFARLVGPDGETITERMLSRDSAGLSTRVTRHAAPQFFTLGVTHILSGPDHMLFLLVVLLGVTDLRRMAYLVSSFTLAHSLTLVLSVLGWVVVPSAIVEPLIAASIIVTAFRNFRAERPRERVMTTFGFGLLHGLGFATALRELGVVGTSLSVVSALAQFNLGVEFGQIALGLLFVPACLWLRRGSLGRAAIPAVSCVAMMVAGVWLIERVLVP